MLFNAILATTALFTGLASSAPTATEKATIAKRGEGIHLVNCYGPGKTFSGIAVSSLFSPFLHLHSINQKRNSTAPTTTHAPIPAATTGFPSVAPIKSLLGKIFLTVLRLGLELDFTFSLRIMRRLSLRTQLSSKSLSLLCFFPFFPAARMMMD